MKESVRVSALGIDFDIHYRLAGKAKERTVLLVHGLGCSLDYWHFVFQDSSLTERFLLAAPDLPGFGRSSKPRAFSYFMKDQAMVLEAFLQALSIRPDVLVGFSMGGPIAIHLAKRLCPQTLVLVEPTITENDLVITPRLAKTPGVLLDALKPFTFLIPALFARLLVNSRQTEILQIVNESLRHTPGRVFQKASKELVLAARDPETFGTFLELPCKKWVVIGEILFKSSHYNPPPSLYQKAKRVVIQGANHAVMLDNPKSFNRAILQACA